MWLLSLSLTHTYLNTHTQKRVTWADTPKHTHRHTYADEPLTHSGMCRCTRTNNFLSNRLHRQLEFLRWRFWCKSCFFMRTNKCFRWLRLQWAVEKEMGKHMQICRCIYMNIVNTHTTHTLFHHSLSLSHTLTQTWHSQKTLSKTHLDSLTD